MRERNLDRSDSVREGNEVLTAEGTPPVKREDNRDLQTSPVANFVAMESSPDWSRYDEDPTASNEQSEREISIENDQSESIVSELTKPNYFVTSNESLRLQVASSHSVDAFLAGIAPILKSLSPYYLNIVKTNIFMVVQEAEMMQLMQQQEYQKAAGGQHLR